MKEIQAKNRKVYLGYFLTVVAIVLFFANLTYSIYTFDKKEFKIEYDFYHFIVIGILFFFTLATFFQFVLLKDHTYIYYVIYVLIYLLYFNLIFTQFGKRADIHWLYDIRYFTSMSLLTLSYFIYIKFAINYIRLSFYKPSIYRAFKIIAKIYFAFFIICVINLLFPISLQFSEILRVVIIFLSIILGIISIALIYLNINNPIARIICIGSSCFLLGSTLGFMFSYGILDYFTTIRPFNHWTFYTQTGTLLEIILFSSTFSYRTKILENEKRSAQALILKEMNEKKEKEHQLRIIRNEIARNLHDDIGASLSNINILNELAKRSADNPDKATEYLNKMGDDITNISESLSDIVWNINPKNDKLDNLFFRMKRHAAEILGGKNIEYEIIFPEENLQILLNMEERRELYLIFKETVNNLAKYSRATLAMINITLVDNELVLVVNDNGVGFDINNVVLGNGLQNIEYRARILGGNVSIVSALNQGTSVRLSFQLKNKSLI